MLVACFFMINRDPNDYDWQADHVYNLCFMIIGDPNDYDWQTDHVYNLCILIIRDLMIMINRQWQTGTCEIYDGENDHKSALSKVDHI